MAADRSARLRHFFARYVAARGGAQDPRIERAFAAVPREPFAGPGPWLVFTASPYPRPAGRDYLQTPCDDPAFLYQDTLIAIDAARGINIGEPGLHARCLDALSPQRGETVLQVGTGSGYYTAILAELVGPDGRVLGFEIDAGLAERSRRNLIPWPQAEVQARSGTADGLPAADAIYVNAGLSRPSRAWLDALRPGGRLLFPLHDIGGWGEMLLVHKPGEDGLAWPARFVSRASFIACQAPHEEDAGSSLTAAFGAGGWQAVQSLRLAGAPDASCWYQGSGWWLSTDAP